MYTALKTFVHCPQGNSNAALVKYMIMAEQGYEVAQSNTAFIFDKGILLKMAQKIKNVIVVIASYGTKRSVLLSPYMGMSVVQPNRMFPAWDCFWG